MTRFRHPTKNHSKSERVARHFNKTGEVLAPDLARRIRMSRLAPVSFVRFGNEVSILLSSGYGRSKWGKPLPREFMITLTADMVKSLLGSPEMKDIPLPRGPHIREDVALSIIRRRLVKGSWR